MSGHSRDCFRLALIRNEIIRATELLKIHGLTRRGIHDAPDAVAPRKLRSVINGSQRNLELQVDRVRSSQKRRGSIHILGSEPIVRALHHDDAVLPAGIYEDRSDAA